MLYQLSYARNSLCRQCLRRFVSFLVSDLSVRKASKNTVIGRNEEPDSDTIGNVIFDSI